jgi:hypothetical protein
MLESHLAITGSARTHLLSLQVMLTDIGHRGEFDTLWPEWMGPHPQHWPQRACFQAALAPGLLVGRGAVAAQASVDLVEIPAAREGEAATGRSRRAESRGARASGVTELHVRNGPP